MYGVILRLKHIPTGENHEVLFDRRLTYAENLTLFFRLLKEEERPYLLYDPEEKIFLDLNLTVEETGAENFRCFYLL